VLDFGSGPGTVLWYFSRSIQNTFAHDVAVSLCPSFSPSESAASNVVSVSNAAVVMLITHCNAHSVAIFLLFAHSNI
jgi:hypothetical protein